MTHLNGTEGHEATIVLVHGAWADASSWTPVIEILQANGFTCTAPPNNLRGVAKDAAYVRAFLGTIEGPIVLVGHSYGGVVITNAATGVPNVKALVYVDAFIPDEGQVVGGLIGPESALAAAATDPTSLFKLSPYPDGPAGDFDTYLLPIVVESKFANDLTPTQAAVITATQRPASLQTVGEPSGPPAWKDIPAWALIGTQDRIIPPNALRAMAEHAGAQITEIDASHVSMISHPDAVADLIDTVAARVSDAIGVSA